MLYLLTENSKKIDSHTIHNDVLTMNSVVEVINEATKKPMPIKIVYPKDADFNNGFVSVFSPLCIALLGYKIGDSVQFDAPKGIVTIKILEINYQPEANGEYLL